MARASQQDVDQLISTYTAAAGRTLVHSPIQRQKEIDNPEFQALSSPRKAVERAKAARGETAIPEKVAVNIQQWRGPDQMIEAYQIPGTGDWEVETQRNEVPAAASSASSVGPEQRALAEAKAKAEKDQRDWNRTHGPRSINPDTGQEYGASAPGSGLDETHAERTKREYDAQDQGIQVDAAARAARAEDRTIENTANQIEQQRKQNELAQAKFDYDVTKDQRPQLAGTPNDSTKNIAVWDPVSQTLGSVENPMYDEAKAQAARLKDQLSTGIALNQITAQQAAQQYKQWWDTNVELPFKQAAEVRARATEQREALAAEDRRKQFASDFSLRQNTLGFNAGDAAVKNEISLLPYRAGPTEAAEMSSAITSLGRGGKIAGPDASAGINFTPEAFQFDRPDFDKIAQRATKNALKGITKYTPEGTFSQGDYSGISMPSGQGAPSSTGGGVDLSGLWNQYLQNGVAPYQGPQDDAKG